ncbi:MAG: hypothetical protein M1436_00985, partial [Acidobacteria bacterium]|nr:hypothetical protein [Acidobacteriota bacterium]
MPSVFTRYLRAVVPLFIPFLLCANAQSPSEEKSVLQYLDQTIAWYRDVAAVTGSNATQKDALFADNLRQSSLEALRSAFQFARADAALPSAKAQPGAAPDDSRSRNLVQAQSLADQRIVQVEGRIGELDRKLRSAPPRLRPLLQAEREKLAGDLNLAKARRGALHNLIGLLNGSGAGLPGDIDDLERSVPELQKAQNTTAAPAGSTATTSQEFHADSAGIVGLTTELFGISRRGRNLDRILRSTAKLRKANEGLRAPLRSALREVIQRGDAIALLPETASPAEFTAARKELDGLLARFKLLSATVGPL